MASELVAHICLYLSVYLSIFVSVFVYIEVHVSGTQVADAWRHGVSIGGSAAEATVWLSRERESPSDLALVDFITFY